MYQTPNPSTDAHSNAGHGCQTTKGGLCDSPAAHLPATSASTPAGNFGPATIIEEDGVELLRFESKLLPGKVFVFEKTRGKRRGSELQYFKCRACLELAKDGLVCLTQIRTINVRNGIMETDPEKPSGVKHVCLSERRSKAAATPAPSRPQMARRSGGPPKNPVHPKQKTPTAELTNMPPGQLEESADEGDSTTDQPAGVAPTNLVDELVYAPTDTSTNLVDEVVFMDHPSKGNSVASAPTGHSTSFDDEVIWLDDDDDPPVKQEPSSPKKPRLSSESSAVSPKSSRRQRKLPADKANVSPTQPSQLPEPNTPTGTAGKATVRYGPAILDKDPSIVKFENVFGGYYTFKVLQTKKLPKDGAIQVVRTYRCVDCMNLMDELKLKYDVPIVKTLNNIFVERDPDQPLGNNHFCMKLK